MKILEVSRYKNNFADHQLPFVTEQGEMKDNIKRYEQRNGKCGEG